MLQLLPCMVQELQMVSFWSPQNAGNKAASGKLKSSICTTPTWATDNYEPAGVQEQVHVVPGLPWFETWKNTTAEAEWPMYWAVKHTWFNKRRLYFTTNGTRFAYGEREHQLVWLTALSTVRAPTLIGRTHPAVWGMFQTNWPFW